MQTSFTPPARCEHWASQQPCEEPHSATQSFCPDVRRTPSQTFSVLCPDVRRPLLRLFQCLVQTFADPSSDFISVSFFFADLLGHSVFLGVFLLSGFIYLFFLFFVSLLPLCPTASPFTLCCVNLLDQVSRSCTRLAPYVRIKTQRAQGGDTRLTACYALGRPCRHAHRSYFTNIY